MRLFVVAAVLGLAACNPSSGGDAGTAAAPEIAQAAGPNNCPASASSQWSTGNQAFAIEALAAGADCASAQATLTFRNAAGATLYSETFEARQVMVLAGAESVDDMQRRLNEWINPPGAAPDSTDDLPEWSPGAQTPMSEGFPFYPEQGVDRAAYAAIRASGAPMFCFVQGMESQVCLTARDGALLTIGVQTFPG